MMILRKKISVLSFSLAGLMILSATEKEEPASPAYEIQGKVPEGWEVVELADAPPIEKWIELKNGEKKKILVKPFGLKPVVDETSNFTVSNPLQTAAGESLEDALEEQSINLTQSEEELSLLLNRLKALLSSLPTTTEN